MKLNKAMKLFCFLGVILCAITGGIIGVFFEKTSNLSPNDVVSTVLLAGSILLCILILKDVKDQKKPHSSTGKNKRFRDLIRSEFQSLKAEIRSSTTRPGLVAYFLWATSQYIILILFADFQMKHTYTVILMMCGYLIGVAILGFCKQIADEKMIRTGFRVTIASFLAFFIVNYFLDDNTVITSISCFFYTLGNAFLSPSMLSLFSKERTIHEQGKGFGLIVSADTSGFLAGSIIVIIMNHLSLKMEYVFLISATAFLISWFPYTKYEKRRSNATKNGKNGLLFLNSHD